MFSRKREAQITAANRRLTELVETEPLDTLKTQQQVACILKLIGFTPITPVESGLRLIWLAQLILLQVGTWQNRLLRRLGLGGFIFSQIVAACLLFQNLSSLGAVIVILLVNAQTIIVFVLIAVLGTKSILVFEKSKTASLQTYWKHHDIPTSLYVGASGLLDIIYMDGLIISVPTKENGPSVIVMMARCSAIDYLVTTAVWIDFPDSAGKQRETKFASSAS